MNDLVSFANLSKTCAWQQMEGTGTLPMTEFSAQFFGGLRMTSFRDDGRRRDETIRSLSGLPKPRARRQKARRADLRPIRPPVPGAGPGLALDCLPQSQ